MCAGAQFCRPHPVPGTDFPVLAHVVAQTASGDAPPFDIFSLLLPLALAFLIFTMFRRQRKSQKQVKEMRTQMEPGTEVMTQFGLYGTIVSIDQENNKAVLELSPGNLATVHTQALSKVVQQESAVAGDGAEAPADDAAAQRDLDAYDGAPVPDDASSIDGADRAPSAGATAAGTTGSTLGESHEETSERLNREQAVRENRDARDARNPKVNPDN
ncbi:preprotein translocase subunit YajC [Arthrobacter cheniae]|uniref:Preprotein translocase subunit YajC n=1 Tax=Arthrobacter cheniae TaxID=1258888 RepID=A0A3A5MAL3_9MICC|nr:preprotein translocase subunit YajC [Arthrobacter cheniae]